MKDMMCFLRAYPFQAYEGLASGSEQIPVGFAKNAFNAFELKRQEVFGRLLQAMKGRD